MMIHDSGRSELAQCTRSDTDVWKAFQMSALNFPGLLACTITQLLTVNSIQEEKVQYPRFTLTLDSFGDILHFTSSRDYLKDLYLTTEISEWDRQHVNFTPSADLQRLIRRETNALQGLMENCIS